MLYRKILFENTTNLFIQLFRYTLVGGLAFVVDFGLLFFLTEYVRLHYLISATISFLAGLLVNYVISTQWIFRDSKIKNKKVEFILFGLIGVIGLILNNVLIYLFTDVVGLYYMLSKLVTAIIVYMWNFLGRRYFLFNAKSKM
ncbi:GtrA family protein [Bacteroides bouchesdurhonensis]|uniref:GtrA family protein n=1 Tax=Bacteroides bouchesdurhonensis TaxID=1841855 RepID=UPI00097F9ACD|nr:GtrA family protein [Bacteroides bouchesdurhonensis]